MELIKASIVSKEFAELGVSDLNEFLSCFLSILFYTYSASAYQIAFLSGCFFLRTPLPRNIGSPYQAARKHLGVALVHYKANWLPS